MPGIEFDGHEGTGVRPVEGPSVWETEGSFGPRMISVPGWRRTGPDIDYLGREVASPISAGGVLEVEVQTAVRYVPVAPQPQVQNDKSVR